MIVAFVCAYCGKGSMREAGAINRSIARGLSLYCDRVCSDAGRRVILPESERKASKAEYDRRRRAELAERIRAEKAEYHRRTYNPEKARVERKLKMPRHVEYCRQPEYRAKKKVYDRRYRLEKEYGPFAEAAGVLLDLEHEIDERAPDKVELRRQKGTLNKHQQRKRDYAKRTTHPQAVRGIA